MIENEYFKFKKILFEKKQELENALKSLKESSKPVDLDDPIGRLSRMDAIQQQQMVLSAKKKTEITLNQIKAALERINDESYGYCLNCDEKISIKRLLAKPEAPFCTKCQSAIKL